MLASGMSTSKTSSATTTRSAGSSSAVQHDSIVVLPDPGPGAPYFIGERSGNPLGFRVSVLQKNRSRCWSPWARVSVAFTVPAGLRVVPRAGSGEAVAAFSLVGERDRWADVDSRTFRQIAFGVHDLPVARVIGAASCEWGSVIEMEVVGVAPVDVGAY